MQAQMYVPPLSKINKMIIIVTVAVFLLNSILGLAGKMSLVPWLGLSWAGLSGGLVYQPLTFVFMESSLMGVLFNCLLIWFIGSELEQKWGPIFYLKYLVLSVLASACVYVALSLTGVTGGLLAGLGGVTYSLLVAYGLLFSDRMLTFMLIFPMKAKYFCMVLAGMQLYLGVFSGGGLVSLVHLSAMIFGFIYLKWASMKARGVTLSDVMEKKRRNKQKRSLYIVPDEEKDKADPKDPRFWQ